MPLTSILAPVDFSEDSVRGASLARDIAGRHAARLTLLHVDGLPSYTEHVAQAAPAGGWADYFEQRDELLRQALRDLASRLQCPSDVECVLARGDAAKSIAEHARKQNCDLVVVSPRGSGYGHQFLLGSVSTELASSATCPVLVARARSGPVSETGAFANPLVTVSNVQLAEQALSLTMDLTQRNTTVQLLHVLESLEISVGPPLPGAFQQAVQRRREELEAELRRLAEPIEREGFATSIRVESGNPSFSILCRLETDPSGLVVVSRKTRADGQGALATPAYRMLKHSPVPVLVVPGVAAAAS